MARHRGAVDTKRLARAVDLYKSGSTLSEIGKHLGGISAQTVEGYLLRHAPEVIVARRAEKGTA